MTLASPDISEINSAESDINPNYGTMETTLGVAVNRTTQRYVYHDGPYDVYVNDYRNTLILDVENDPLLQEAFKKISLAVGEVDNPLVRAKRAASAVISLQRIDDNNEYHSDSRTRYLGEALQNPVVCLERALTIEAALKMVRVSQDARILPADIRQGKPPLFQKHTDVIFSFKNRPKNYVVITTEERAGQILTEEDYLQYRASLSETKEEYWEVKDNKWTKSYFEPINNSH